MKINHCKPHCIQCSLQGTPLAVSGWDFSFQCMGHGFNSWSGQGVLGSHMPCAERPKTKEQKQYSDGFHKDFKNGPHQKTFKKSNHQ